MTFKIIHNFNNDFPVFIEDHSINILFNKSYWCILKVHKFIKINILFNNSKET